ncbi:Protein of unknown function [Cotesia congregata]|uniref:Uncharacterized protein n=1 Tax=Cotesia congregata TaxID=51543 RepID=A0A8J2MIV6_COTCN|nr:Protein of unknown function [Cotesia congregata]
MLGQRFNATEIKLKNSTLETILSLGKNDSPIGSGPCYQSIGPGSNPAYTNEYFQYLSVLFCSAQEIQTSSNLKSLPPTVIVAHDLKLLCTESEVLKFLKKFIKMI